MEGIDFQVIDSGCHFICVFELRLLVSELYGIPNGYLNFDPVVFVIGNNTGHVISQEVD